MRIYPNGTYVITLVPKEKIAQGSLGTVVGSFVEESDGQKVGIRHYNIQFPRKGLYKYKPEEIEVHRESLRTCLEKTAVTYESVKDSVLLKVLVGSRAYGIDTAESDYDYKGAYAMPSKYLWGCFNYNDEVEKIDLSGPVKVETKFFEIGKLVRLALAGNPNVVELGVIPNADVLHPIIMPLIERWEELFVSIRVFQAYQGYAVGQLKRFTNDLNEGREVCWKHASTLLRLLHSGTECLKTGHFLVRPHEEVRTMLIKMRNSEFSSKEFFEIKETFEKEFAEAFEEADRKKSIPPTGNSEEANRLLIQIREEIYEREK